MPLLMILIQNIADIIETPYLKDKSHTFGKNVLVGKNVQVGINCLNWT